MKVIVIGAGVIGASIAYALSRKGVSVTVLEQALPASAATSKSFGWINASSAETPEYYRLRIAAIEEHKRLAATLGLDDAVRWHGGLWWEEEGEGLEKQASALAALGYEIDLLDRAGFAALEPHVADPPERCIHTLMEGAADPIGLTRALLSAAAKNGASVLAGCQVTGLLRDGDTFATVQTSAGQFHADRIVLAGGVGTQSMLEAAGLHLPMDNKPGLILHTEPVAPVVDHLILSPEIHFWQKPDGAIIAGDDYGGGDMGEDLPDGPADLAARVLEKVQKRLPKVGPLNTAHIMLGVRPMPVDGFPAIGTPSGGDGLYIASMHSGITLGPLIGRLAADSIVDGIESPLLEPYRAARFN